MPDNKYCYPGTDILINKMNLRDNELLEAAERELSVRRVNQLINNPIHGSFDFDHLKAIHKYIFQDVYSWAGEERTVNIANVCPAGAGANPYKSPAGDRRPLSRAKSQNSIPGVCTVMVVQKCDFLACIKALIYRMNMHNISAFYDAEDPGGKCL